MHPEFFTLHRGDEDRSSMSPTQPPYSLTLTYNRRKACLLHVLHARYSVDSHSQEKTSRRAAAQAPPQVSRGWQLV